MSRRGFSASLTIHVYLPCIFLICRIFVTRCSGKASCGHPDSVCNNWSVTMGLRVRSPVEGLEFVECVLPTRYYVVARASGPLRPRERVRVFREESSPLPGLFPPMSFKGAAFSSPRHGEPPYSMGCRCRVARAHHQRCLPPGIHAPILVTSSLYLSLRTAIIDA